MDIRAKNKKVWARSKPFFSRNERRKWERRSSWKTGWHVLLLDVRPCQTTYRRSKFTFKYVGHMFDSTMHPHWFMVLGTFQLSSRLFFFFVFFFFYFHSYYGMVLNSSSGASPKSVTSLFLWFHGAGISRAHRTVPDITVWMDWNSARRSIHVIWQKAKEKEKPTCVCVCVISSLSFPFVRGKVFFFSSSRNCERNGKDYQRINGLWKSHAQLSARARWSLQRRQSISCYLIPDRVLEQLSPLLQLSSISQ